MDPQAIRRRNDIALKYYELLCTTRHVFISYAPYGKSFDYFNYAKVERNELHSFDDPTKLPRGTTVDLSEERRGEIAYAVLKFETAFGCLNTHLWADDDRDEVAARCGVDPVEFEQFAIALHQTVVAEYAAICAAREQTERDQQL